MSYARFSADSDVYVFTSDRGLECCGCLLVPRHWVKGGKYGPFLEQDNPADTETYHSNAAMLEHMAVHRAAGHLVPDDVFERLEDPDDAVENEKIWSAHDKPS